MIIVAGLDVGSLATKTVILDQEQRVMSYDISLTIGDSRGAAESSFRNALAKAGLKKDIGKKSEIIVVAGLDIGSLATKTVI